MQVLKQDGETLHINVGSDGEHIIVAKLECYPMIRISEQIVADPSNEEECFLYSQDIPKLIEALQAAYAMKDED